MKIIAGIILGLIAAFALNMASPISSVRVLYVIGSFCLTGSMAAFMAGMSLPFVFGKK